MSLRFSGSLALFALPTDAVLDGSDDGVGGRVKVDGDDDAYPLGPGATTDAACCCCC